MIWFSRPNLGHFPVLLLLLAAPDASAQSQPTDAELADDAELAEVQAALANDRSATSSTPANAAGTPALPGGSGGPQSMNPDLSLIGSFALAAFSGDEPRQTGHHDPTENGFNLQQLEFALGAAVDPFFRFDASLLFGLEGVEVEEAYATTLDLGARLQARVGQFLTRFGRRNPTHLHAWNFVDQPFILGRVFGGEGNRGLGLELSYLTPLPWYAEVVLSSVLARGEGAARSFYPDEEHRVDEVSDLLYVAALKQFFPLSDDWSLAFGVSSAVGPNANGHGQRSDVYGADLYLKYRPISEPGSSELGLEAEWIYRRRELSEGLLQDAGGYLEFVAKFRRRYAAALRYELGTPSYDDGGEVAPDPLDPEWTTARVRTSAALTYNPSEFSRLRWQVSRDSVSSSSIWATFLAVEFVTGAHGAHPF